MRAVAIVLTGLLVGCASTGVKVSEDALATLKPGQTTYREVVAKLGAPTGESRVQGVHTMSYTYATSQVRATTFIPVVGMFAGGADTRSQTVTLNFDSADILKGVDTSMSTIGVGTGLAAAGAAGDTAQPRVAQ